MSKYMSREDLLADATQYYEMRCTELEGIVRTLLDYTAAIPKDTVMPTVVGIDRDWVEQVLKEGEF